MIVTLNLMLRAFIVIAIVTARALLPAQGSVDPKLGVVLPENEGPKLLNQCGREVPGPVKGTWKPSDEVIRTLELALAPAFQKALDREQTQKRRKPSEYGRQYAGLVIGKKRIVYINGFRQSIIDEAEERHRTYLEIDLIPWRTEALCICDGGTAFFGAEYDPGSKRIANIKFNGVLGTPSLSLDSSGRK